MKRILFALALLCAAITAPCQTVTVSGSKIEDSSGSPCADCTISFAPVSNSGVPLSYKLGGGGQALTRAVTAEVAAGAFSVSLADTAATNPANVCFKVSVTDNVSGDSGLLGPGYTCVQPASSGQSSWCTTTSGVTTCDFDNYVPRTSGLAVVTAGPIGPVGPTGATGATGASGSPATSSALGTVELAAGQSSTTLSTIATSGSASDIAAGTLPAARNGAVLPDSTSIPLVCYSDSYCAYGEGSDASQTFAGILTTLPALAGRTTLGDLTIAAYPGDTCAEVASYYSSVIHPLSPAVTGVPKIMWFDCGLNDYSLGTPLATLESTYDSLLSEIRADGWTLILSVPPSRLDIWNTPIDANVRIPMARHIYGDAIASDCIVDFGTFMPDPTDESAFDYPGTNNGTHPTLLSRTLAADQANACLMGYKNADSRSSSFVYQPYQTISNVALPAETTTDRSAVNAWTLLGEWSIQPSVDPGSDTRPLVMTIGGWGGSRVFGFLYLQIIANTVQTNPVDGVTGTFLPLMNTNDSSTSEVQTIKIVEHPGTANPGFDWDIYEQGASLYGGVHVAQATTSPLYSWTPLMTANATSPGADSSTVKTIPQTPIAVSGQPFTTPTLTITASDGTTGGTLSSPATGVETITAATSIQSTIDGVIEQTINYYANFLYEQIISTSGASFGGPVTATSFNGVALETSGSASTCLTAAGTYAASCGTRSSSFSSPLPYGPQYGSAGAQAAVAQQFSNAITVVGVRIYYTNAATCTTYPIFELWDSTAGAVVAGTEITLNGTNTNYYSGAISAAVPSGHVIYGSWSNAASCSTYPGAITQFSASYTE